MVVQRKSMQVKYLEENTPADFAAAPIRTAGIAITKHPNAATNERIWARRGDFDERTRWKYTCHGRPPHT